MYGDSLSLFGSPFFPPQIFGKVVLEEDTRPGRLGDSHESAVAIGVPAYSKTVIFFG